MRGQTCRRKVRREQYYERAKRGEATFIQWLHKYWLTAYHLGNAEKMLVSKIGVVVAILRLLVSMRR